MSITGPVAEFALGLADLFEPLLDRLSTPEDLEYLFSRYGWRVELDETAFAALSEGLAAKEALQEFLDVAGPLRQQLAGGASGLSPEDVAALARALDAAIQAISGFQAATLGGLPAPLDAEEFWTDIGEHLLDDLLEEYLRIYHPGTYVVLLAAGVVRYESTVPEGAHRRPYRRIRVDWSQAGRLAEDPSGTLQRLYRWGSESEPLDHAVAGRRARPGAARPARRHRPSDPGHRRGAAAGRFAVPHRRQGRRTAHDIRPRPVRRRRGDLRDRPAAADRGPRRRRATDRRDPQPDRSGAAPRAPCHSAG